MKEQPVSVHRPMYIKAQAVLPDYVITCAVENLAAISYLTLCIQLIGTSFQKYINKLLNDKFRKIVCS
jgi:hypothetical protein